MTGLTCCNLTSVVDRPTTIPSTSGDRWAQAVKPKQARAVASAADCAVRCTIEGGVVGGRGGGAHHWRDRRHCSSNSTTLCNYLCVRSLTLIASMAVLQGTSVAAALRQ
jgi:hypothetical protein